MRQRSLLLRACLCLPRARVLRPAAVSGRDAGAELEEPEQSKAVGEIDALRGAILAATGAGQITDASPAGQEWHRIRCSWRYDGASLLALGQGTGPILTPHLWRGAAASCQR
jgi:hypothetical protein